MSASDIRRPREAISVSLPNRRDMIAGGLLMAMTAASIALRPVRMFPNLTHDELSDAIPKIIGDYSFATSSGLILPPADELSERLYDQVLTRVYLAPGRLPIMALFAYGSVQNLSLELHRPDECYPQQGFTISDPTPLAIDVGEHRIPAAILTARRLGGYVEQVAFWSRIGTRFPATRSAQSWLVAQENFAGRMPDGLLVRLSVPTGDRAQGILAVRSFIEALARTLTPLGRKILFGQSQTKASSS